MLSVTLKSAIAFLRNLYWEKNQQKLEIQSCAELGMQRTCIPAFCDLFLNARLILRSVQDLCNGKKAAGFWS